VVGSGILGCGCDCGSVRKRPLLKEADIKIGGATVRDTGWVILGLLIVIGLLSYFGFFYGA